MIFTIAVTAVGCTKPLTPLVAPPQAEVVKKFEHLFSDEQKIALLRGEAKKRNLKWRINCMDWVPEGDKDQFIGSAWHKGEANISQYERWLEEGHTQGDTAFRLYLSIQGAPTHPALPSSSEAPHYHRICPPELRGE